MIKQLLNSVIAKYRDLSVSRRSIIGLLPTGKSRYFAQPRPIIVNYFISTGITGKIAELLMQVMYGIRPIIKARINKFANATRFGKFFEFCTHFAPALMTQNSFPFWNPLWRHIQTSSSVSGNSSGILVTVFFSR